MTTATLILAASAAMNAGSFSPGSVSGTGAGSLSSVGSGIQAPSEPSPWLLLFIGVVVAVLVVWTGVLFIRGYLRGRALDAQVTAASFYVSRMTNSEDGGNRL